MGEFRWWAPRDQNERSARWLLLGASAIAALLALGYAAAAIAIVLWGEIGGSGEPGDRLANLDWWWIAIGAVATFALVTTLVTFLGSSRAAPLALHRVRALDPASNHDATLEWGSAHARNALDVAAIGIGIPAPRLWLVDDPAPNALVAGSAHAGHVCLTYGALKLPSREVDALCVHSMVRLARSDVTLAAAGATVLIAADRVVRWTWLLSTVFLFTMFVGVPPSVAGSVIAAMFVLLLIALPLLALGSRFAVRLTDRAGSLADLETVELTNQPRALADLLLKMLEDDRRVQTSWQVAHLWFERDGAWRGESGTLTPDPGPIATLFSRSSRRPLLARAAVAVDLANGDRHLRTRLDRLERAAVD